ncbi:MAG: hypothetical protein HGN29_14990 [Asgard group archaeon]|nr:hypothetical protein [Asgard group archaeon]
MDRRVRIFGIPQAGKTVYLSVLFGEIDRYGFENYILDMRDHADSMDYLSMVLEDLVLQGSTFSTPERQFKELNMKLSYQEDGKVKTAALISTYDLSGEDINIIFDARFHSQIRKSIIPPEFKESQKKIMNMLYTGDCFILLVDPNPIGSTFDDQDTMFTIILRIIKKNKGKRKSQKDKRYGIVEGIKIAFCISKSDLIDIPDAREFVEQKMPFTYKYLEINFKNNFKCIPISSLGYNAETRQYPMKENIRPINVLEPLRFFLDK